MRNLVATRRSSWSPESASRNWIGMATRPLSSTACSKWPRNIPPAVGNHLSTLGSTSPHLTPQHRHDAPQRSYLASEIFEGSGGARPRRRGGECGPPEEVCKPDSVPPPRKREQQPFVWSPGCPGDRATDPREAGGPPV